jgi:hypothetical protein
MKSNLVFIIASSEVRGVKEYHSWTCSDRYYRELCRNFKEQYQRNNPRVIRRYPLYFGGIKLIEIWNRLDYIYSSLVDGELTESQLPHKIK